MSGCSISHDVISAGSVSFGDLRSKLPSEMIWLSDLENMVSPIEADENGDMIHWLSQQYKILETG